MRTLAPAQKRCSSGGRCPSSREVPVKLSPSGSRFQPRFTHTFEHISIDHRPLAQANQATAPATIQRAVDVEECSEDYDAHIRQAVREARSGIVTTVNKILQDDPPQEVTDAFRTYFGATSSEASIGLRLMKIRLGLKDATVECENPGELLYDFFCGGNLAYVRGVPAFFGVGNIHVCQPSFDNLTALQRMATMVHEGAHRFIDADDEAYYTLDCAQTDKTRALDDSDRRDNADSYGCLVQTLA